MEHTSFSGTGQAIENPQLRNLDQVETFHYLLAVASVTSDETTSRNFMMVEKLDDVARSIATSGATNNGFLLWTDVVEKGLQEFAGSRLHRFQGPVVGGILAFGSIEGANNGTLSIFEQRNIPGSWQVVLFELDGRSNIDDLAVTAQLSQINIADRLRPRLVGASVRIRGLLRHFPLHRVSIGQYCAILLSKHQNTPHRRNRGTYPGLEIRKLEKSFHGCRR